MGQPTQTPLARSGEEVFAVRRLPSGGRLLVVDWGPTRWVARVAGVWTVRQAAALWQSDRWRFRQADAEAVPPAANVVV